MIIISRKAIDSTLEETVKAHKSGNLLSFQNGIITKLKSEKPHLSDYINSSHASLLENKSMLGVFYPAAFMSGANLTYRMIEAQLRIDQKPSPLITRRDIEASNQEASTISQMDVEDITLAKISKIKSKNPIFGDYVFGYISVAKSEDLSRGFAIGVVSTYSVYEQALK